MKLTAILLLTASLHVAANGFSQNRITLDLKNVPVQTVLKEISKQTGISIIYKESLFKGLPPVSIQVKNATVQEVMDKCLAGQAVDYALEGSKIVIRRKGKMGVGVLEPEGTPPIDVRGRIVNEKGEPVAASIMVKGTNKGTTTNDNGEFELKEVDENATLVISGVNIETFEWKVAGKTELKLIAKTRTIQMEDVTVEANTGYQKIKPSHTTGSVEIVSNHQLNRQVSTDIISRLDYNANGVFISKVRSQPEIAIRGLSTLRSSTAPLIILDDFPYYGDMNNINPNDVESITILKDAAASAIWGARAGNGVIVITTKRGKYNQKPNISFNSNVTIQREPDFFKDRSYMNPSDFIDVEKFLYEKGFYASALNNTINRPIVSPVVEILAKLDAGQITQADADAQINALRNLDIRNDYQKYLYRDAVNQQYSLAVDGGGNQFNYRLSIGYDKNLNSVIGIEDDRATLLSKIGFKPHKKIEIDATIIYTHNTAKSNGISDLNPGSSKARYYPYAQLADENGNPAVLPKNYRTAWLDTAGGGLLLDWKYRPLDELGLADNSTRSQDIQIKLRTIYQILTPLSFELSGQFGKGTLTRRNYFNVETYEARNWINRYTTINGAVVTRNVPLGGILNQSNSDLNSHSLRAQANFNKNWDERHQLIGIIGAEVGQSHTELFGSSVYGYDDSKLTYLNVDHVSNFQLYGNLGSGSIPSNIDFDNTTTRFVSLFSNASYIFLRRYSFSLSARKDGSNLFGVNSNNKWKPLWSSGVAWKVSEEPFYKFSNTFPVLQLRVTYGYNGNPPVAIAQPVIQYVGIPSGLSNLYYAAINSLPNPELRWEKVRTVNVGLDFETKNKRFGGTIEYFNKNATDLISAFPIDPTTGDDRIDANVASLKGNGIDLKLTYVVLNTSVRWNTILNFSYVRNTVAKFFNESGNKGGYPGFNYNITPIVDKDPYALISFRWGGLDPQTGDPIGYINGVASKDYTNITRPTTFDDIVFTGATRPPYFGNLMNRISFRGFDLSFNISYRFGYYFRRSTLSYSGLFDGWATHSDFERRWQKPGDELFTTIPSMIYPAITRRESFYALSEATVEKGDHIRFTDLNINYTFNPLQSKKAFRDLNIYVYMKNIGILWRANNLDVDPEYGDGMPAPFGVAFGVRANF